MKIAIVLGTRPEIIKLSPVIRECENRGLDSFILHSGQHYSYNMDKVFFTQLALPDAKYNLDIGSGTHAEQTGRILIGVEKVLEKEKPDIVLVEGDTNTVLSGALAAAKLGIKVGHVEAGLRSFDRQMPEEINRVLADHCSDFLFAPTEKSKQTLLNEGIAEEKIHVTGNTVVDAVHANLKLAKEKTNILKRLRLSKDQYFLTTVHRQENVDSRKRFQGILKGLKGVKERFNLPVIYPIHPRARKQAKCFELDIEGLSLVDPLDYLDFLQLESFARLVLTDSGGVQEETCILKVPCVTLRYNTERPETIDVGANILAGTEPTEIINKTSSMLSVDRNWPNPFGDGKSGKRIVRVLEEHF